MGLPPVDVLGVLKRILWQQSGRPATAPPVD
jgi:hypothetical protein